jgi:hypothetical protein
MLLCIRETSRKPKTMKFTSIVEAQPMLSKHRASRKQWKIYFQIAEAQPVLSKHRASRKP